MYYFRFSVIIIKNPIGSPALAKIQCLYFASRWWSLSSQSSAALHCPSSWWNRISRLFPFTEEWPRRRGETLVSSFYTSSHKYAQLMPSVFMKHEALPDKWTRALVSSASVLAILFISVLSGHYFIADCLAISNLKPSKDGSWWPPIFLDEEWTLSESISSSTMTCQKTLTPICTGWEYRE